MFKLPSNTSLFNFNVAGGPELRVARFSGREGMSQLYNYQLELASPDLEINFADVVGRAANLTILAGEVPRVVHGHLARFEELEIGSDLAIYRATLVPWVSRLLHRRDCRIFQNLAVPDIIAKALEEAGLPSDRFLLEIREDHPKREYVVQYRESDWSFLARLMEEEGIFYYFDHHPDEHILVMSDSATVHSRIPGAPGIPYLPLRGMVADQEFIASFRSGREMRAGKVTLRDYNFKKPAMNLETEIQGPSYSELEVYDYPGLYEEPTPGTARAKTRLEEQQASVQTSRGDSACARLTPGSLFSLERHPRSDFNREYLIVDIEQSGYQPQVLEQEATAEASEYSNNFSCIPSDVPFRPARKTPKPVVRGIQTAIVVGPSGEEVYTDEHGRVKVQFHWDRRGKSDQDSSCWIRVSQLWAGQAWGAMWIPRIGHEVVVDFLEGDPDRPLITGRVYHGTNVPPYELPAEKTKSTIKSSSSPGGDGSNELRFEDASGSEEIYLHGQKDWTIRIENDKDQAIGHDEYLSVDNNRDKTVGVDQSETIGSNKTIRVGQNHTESIGQNMVLTVGMTKTEVVGINSSETVGAMKELTTGSDYLITVGANMTETIAKNRSTTVDGSRTEEVTGPASTHAKRVLIEAKDEIVLRTGEALIVMKKNGDITIEAGGVFKVISKKDTTVRASGNVVLKGQKISKN